MRWWLEDGELVIDLVFWFSRGANGLRFSSF